MGEFMIRQRNIVLCILLTIITCGLYGIYWFISMTDDVARANNNPDFSGGKSFLFTIITCGIYFFYWSYKVGKEMCEARQKVGMPANDNSVIYIILSIFGLGIITYCLVQDELNKFARQGA